MRRKKRYFSRGMLTVLAAVFAFLFLMPTVLTITNSFMTQSEITANYGQVFQNATDGKSYIKDKINLKFIPDKVSFTQYFTVLLKSPDFLYKFWNSVILVAPIVLAQLAVAPFSVFLLTRSMRRIPASLIESAKLDGAGEWHIFWNICLPQCRSALYSIAILVFIDYWNMVEQPLILLPDASQQPLSVYLSQINAGEIGIAFAAAVIYMVPGLLMFLHGEAYLVEGITYAGSVKG